MGIPESEVFQPLLPVFENLLLKGGDMRLAPVVGDLSDPEPGHHFRALRRPAMIGIEGHDTPRDQVGPREELIRCGGLSERCRLSPSHPGQRQKQAQGKLIRRHAPLRRLFDFETTAMPQSLEMIQNRLQEPGRSCEVEVNTRIFLAHKQPGLAAKT